MEILEFLQSRQSIPAKMLTDPVPSQAQLGEIFQAAVAAPDHGKLQPWRFIIIEGEARHQLGDTFVRATQLREPDAHEERLEAIRSKPLRSPMIIAVCAIIEPDHPKTPEVEQIISAACAAHSVMMGLNALHFGAIMLTGPNAHDNTVKKELGLAARDVIVGFIYTGTQIDRLPAKSRPDYQAFLEYYTPNAQ